MKMEISAFLIHSTGRDFGRYHSEGRDMVQELQSINTDLRARFPTHDLFPTTTGEELKEPFVLTTHINTVL